MSASRRATSVPPAVVSPRLRCRIDIQDHGGGNELVQLERIQIVVNAALAADRLARRSLNVALVDAVASARLHRQHFNVGGRTDVMSFPDGTVDPETNCIHLGDLAVCPAVAVTMARKLKRDAADELTLYVLHGLLHLLGHDDHEPAERKIMWDLQKIYMKRIGVALDDG